MLSQNIQAQALHSWQWARVALCVGHQLINKLHCLLKALNWTQASDETLGKPADKQA